MRFDMGNESHPFYYCANGMEIFEIPHSSPRRNWKGAEVVIAWISSVSLPSFFTRWAESCSMVVES